MPIAAVQGGVVMRSSWSSSDCFTASLELKCEALSSVQAHTAYNKSLQLFPGSFSHAFEDGCSQQLKDSDHIHADDKILLLVIDC